MCIFFNGLSKLYIIDMQFVTLKKGIVVVKRKIVNVEKWVVSTQIILIFCFAKIFTKKMIYVKFFENSI
jgi:hypothetical protein